MKVGPLLAHLCELERGYAQALRGAGERQRDEHDVYHQCQTFAVAAETRAGRLEPVATRYGGRAEWANVVRAPGGDLLEELRALYLEAEECGITWVMAGQAAQAARDAELLELVRACHPEVAIQAKWFVTRIKTAAPQALVAG
jgi:hypothetical protein